MIIIIIVIIIIIINRNVIQGAMRIVGEEVGMEKNVQKMKL